MWNICITIEFKHLILEMFKTPMLCKTCKEKSTENEKHHLCKVCFSIKMKERQEKRNLKQLEKYRVCLI